MKLTSSFLFSFVSSISLCLYIKIALASVHSFMKRIVPGECKLSIKFLETKLNKPSLSDFKILSTKNLHQHQQKKRRNKWSDETTIEKRGNSVSSLKKEEFLPK